ncbi:MAG: MFS transporter, partial [Sphingomonadales bacterium]
MKWYYGWNVIAVALVFEIATVGIGFSCFTFWVTPWLDEFDVGRGHIMLAVAFATISNGILSPIAGWLMERWSMRVIVPMGLLLFAGGLALVSVATAAWQILAIYAICVASGLAFAGSLAGQALASQWFPGRMGLAMALVTCGGSIGGFTMPPLATWLLTEYGWRGANLALGGLVAAIGVPLVWLVLRDPPKREAPAAAAAAAPATPWTTRDIVRERSFWVLGLAFFGASISAYAFQQNIGPYAHDLGFSATQTSPLVSAMYVAVIAGRLLYGTVADRVDSRYPYWISLLLVGVSMLMLALLRPGYELMMGICVLVGLGSGALLPICCTMVGQIFGAPAFGRVMGLVTAFWAVAAASGPVLSGAIRVHTAGYQT